MPKLSRSAIKAKADEWAAIMGKIDLAEIAKNAAIGPVIQRHNEELRPILEKYDKKIEKLQAEADAIESEVIDWLNAQPADTIIEGSRAVAERKTETKVGNRVIDPQRFFELVKAKGSEFWACVRVEIAKAERFLGKSSVDAISTKKETTDIVTQLRVK